MATFNSGERRYDLDVLSAQYHQKTSNEPIMDVTTTDHCGSAIRRASKYEAIPLSAAMYRSSRTSMWFGFMPANAAVKPERVLRAIGLNGLFGRKLNAS
jgi:hypothetical protein